jgi:hypothetical protein
MLARIPALPTAGAAAGPRRSVSDGLVAQAQATGEIASGPPVKPFEHLTLA